MKYLHITDTHFDHLFSPAFFDTQEAMIQDHFKKLDSFINSINSGKEKNIFLTGDISSGRFIKTHLEYLGKKLTNKKLFFVLGNHDFYHSSFETVNEEVKDLLSLEEYKDKLIYLENQSYYDNLSQVLIVGANGWYDGEYSPFVSSTVKMNDYYIIKELNSIRIKSVPALREECKRLSTVAATKIKTDIENGIKQYSPKKVVILTHVPPFKELSTYKGKISNDEWLPCFSSKFFGDTVLETVSNYKEIQFCLFCGHSHDEAYFNPCENIQCRTGKSEYGSPEKSIFRSKF